MYTPVLVGMVKAWEGFAHAAHWDNKQFSNGFGTKALNAREQITQWEAERRMVIALAAAERMLERFFSPAQLKAMGQVRRECCISMIYQMGPGNADGQGGGFGSFLRMREALGEGDWRRAFHEARDSHWFRTDSPTRAHETSVMLMHGRYFWEHGADV